VSRRGLLGAASAGLAGVAAAAAGGFALGKQDVEVAPATPGARSYPFYGTQQAGIVTPVQDRLHFAAFDITTGSRDELVSLL
jgi:deferrochelatase/peroxidase EfeB